MRTDVHVVVEYGMCVTILVEQPLGVRDAKVLEMEQAVRVVLADQLHKSGVMDMMQSEYRAF